MAAKSSKVTGGCLCGAVRYEAEALLGNAYYCHCTQCQKSSGEPFEVGVPVKEGTLRFTGAEPKFYASSEWGQRGFCPECGSRIVWRSTHPDYQWATNITPGSLDRPQDVRPIVHTFVDTQWPWIRIDDRLPRHRAEEMDDVVAQWEKAWKAAL
jgi:hypothetical protein